MKTKLCRKCKIEKSTSDFHKCKSNEDGLQNNCKECKSIYQKQNRSDANKRNKKYRDSDDGKEWYRNYREKNKEYYRLVKRKYAHSTKGKVTSSRSIAKRNRKLGYVELWENPFPPEIKVDYHHINDLFIVPIPSIAHEKTLGKHHRKKCNELLLKIYCLDLEMLLQE